MNLWHRHPDHPFIHPDRLLDLVREISHPAEGQTLRVFLRLLRPTAKTVWTECSEISSRSGASDNGRILSAGMDHRQHVDVTLRDDRINDQIGQPHDRKFARTLHASNAPKHRKPPEHLRCLQDAADHPLGGAFIVARDPCPDRQQIVIRLWREIDVQRLRSRQACSIGIIAVRSRLCSNAFRTFARTNASWPGSTAPPVSGSSQS